MGDKPEEPDPGPEPDPLAGREQSFEEQRLVKLRERAAPPPEQGSPEPAAQPGVEPGGEQASPLPPDFRHGIMDEYRKRQQAAATPDATEPVQQPPEAHMPTPAPPHRSPATRRRARK